MHNMYVYTHIYGWMDAYLCFQLYISKPWLGKVCSICYLLGTHKVTFNCSPSIIHLLNPFSLPTIVLSPRSEKISKTQSLPSGLEANTYYSVWWMLQETYVENTLVACRENTFFACKIQSESSICSLVVVSQNVCFKRPLLYIFSFY